MHFKLLGTLLFLPAICAFQTASAIVKSKSEAVISFSFLPVASQADALDITVVLNKPEILAAGKKYKFHIHENPVSGNDCDTTGGHYDPDGAGKNTVHYKCDPENLKTCEKGDLSGKWGGLERDKEKKTIAEKGIRISDIVGKSVVVHNQDGSKWLCATIVGAD